MSEEVSRRLDEIKVRAQRATEGPWDNEPTYDGPTIFTREFMEPHAGLVDREPHRRKIAVVTSLQPNGSELKLDADAEFIAHVRSDIPFLLDLLEQAQEVMHEIVELKRENAELRSGIAEMQEYRERF